MDRRRKAKKIELPQTYSTGGDECCKHSSRMQTEVMKNLKLQKLFTFFFQNYVTSKKVVKEAFRNVYTDQTMA